MYTVLDVCRYVINYSNKMEYGISNLKLQKLLYFIQAYFLITYDGDPCFNEEIQAWDFGPVVPEAYHQYKVYGSSDIPKIESTIKFIRENGKICVTKQDYKDDTISETDKKRINNVIDGFKSFSASDLVDLTHNQSPWKEAYSKGRNSKIPLESIRSYFNGK